MYVKSVQYSRIQLLTDNNITKTVKYSTPKYLISSKFELKMSIISSVYLIFVCSQSIRFFNYTIYPRGDGRIEGQRFHHITHHR